MRLSLTRSFLYLELLVALGLLGFLIMGIDPKTLNTLGTVSFFGCVLVLIQSLSMLILLSLGERFMGRERATLYQGGAWRQSFLLASLGVALLVAQYFRVLTWWGVLLLIGLVLLLELSYRRLHTFFND